MWVNDFAAGEVCPDGGATKYWYEVLGSNFIVSNKNYKKIQIIRKWNVWNLQVQLWLSCVGLMVVCLFTKQKIFFWICNKNN